MDAREAFELLCQFLNFNTSRDDMRRLAESLTSQGWQELLQAGRQHGVLPLLHHRFRDLKLAPPLPEPVNESLHRVYLNATARNMVMLHHSGSILQALKQHSLDVIPLKGLYLAEAVYPAIGLRTFSDLDLLIRRSDLDAALRTLQETGYRLTTWYDPADPNQDIKHLPPLEKEGWPPIELHWSIMEEEAPFPVDIEGIWQRAVPARIAGVDVLAMDTRDLILHLAIHNTYQHKLRARLRSLYDIALILHQNPGQMNWPCLIDMASGWKMERVLWLTLHLVRDLLGTEISQAGMQQLEPQPPDLYVLEEARRQMVLLEAETPITPDLAALSQTSGLFRRLGLVWSRIFLPRHIIARVYNVDPKSIRIFWCYARRFVGLFKVYSGSAFKLARGDQGALAGANLELEGERLKEWMAGKQN